MGVQTLTRRQQAHVASVFPECRAEMAEFLAAGATVSIGLQDEVRDVPPYAIAVSGTNFWIDCCDTAAKAKAAAKALGLRLSD